MLNHVYYPAKVHANTAYFKIHCLQCTQIQWSWSNPSGASCCPPLSLYRLNTTSSPFHHHSFTITTHHHHSPLQFTITIHHYHSPFDPLYHHSLTNWFRFSTLSPLNIETSGLQFSEYFRATALCSICFDSSHRSYLDLTTQSTCFLRLTDLFGP